jgi:hypothetical protein
MYYLIILAFLLTACGTYARSDNPPYAGTSNGFPSPKPFSHSNLNYKVFYH